MSWERSTMQQIADQVAWDAEFVRVLYKSHAILQIAPDLGWFREERR
ncbi:MAG: hypothetical protein Q7T82_03370 [Armatimonadota bacterium]|nr:hypothetical protein [Armatimonadota bacterium]